MSYFCRFLWEDKEYTKKDKTQTDAHIEFVQEASPSFLSDRAAYANLSLLLERYTGTLNTPLAQVIST